MRLLFVLALCSAFALPVWSAEREDDTIFLQDYIGLCKLLRSKGVEPVTVNWQLVEQSCLGLKTETNQVPYNRCRFEKASDLALFRDDDAACQDEAREAYPDTLLTRRTEVVVTDQNGATTNAVITKQPLSPKDLDGKRRGKFSHCMRERGWKDGNNALRGRVKESKE